MTNLRSWFRPRFSLRLLLLGVTAFAVGFPIWYRWPYEDVEDLTVPGTKSQTRITTWRWLWGGGRLPHGPQRFLIDGQLYELTTYQDGRKEGPYRVRGLKYPTVNGTSIYEVDPLEVETGQYANGVKNGVWTQLADGQKQVTIYDHGKQISPPPAN